MYRYSPDIPLLHATVDDLASKTLYYHSCDTEESFLTAKERLGPEWFYNNNPISYNFNSLGYRTVELEEVKDDFIVSFGCSYTSGIALHKEDIWVEQLGKKLNKQVLNLGMEAIGNIFTFHNNYLFYDWCKKNNKTPSGVFIQLTFNHRREFFCTYDGKIEIQPTPSILPPRTKTDYPPEFTHDYEWFKSRYNPDPAERTIISDIYPRIISSLWEGLNVPIYFFTFGCDFEYDLLHTNDLDIEVVTAKYSHDGEYARDLQHNGRKEHKKVATILAKKYNNG